MQLKRHEQTFRAIHCCGCDKEVPARLTNGAEIYPHRKDLASVPFWKCDSCGNYVGCHHKTLQRTRPLGVIPTPEIKRIRKQIHAIIDPIWRGKRLSRGAVYKRMAAQLGTREYHTAELSSEAMASRALEAAKQIEQEAA